ncbi:alpha/beta fold hydrolase family protein [Deinococcus sp. YIM 134068]
MTRPAAVLPLAAPADPTPVRRTVRLFRHEPLLLDCGRPVNDVRLTYHTYGTPGDHAILVLHALTGTSAVHEWWPDFLGEGRPLDPTRDYVVCANVIGGCAGSSGPGELGDGADVPLSLRDMARAGRALLEHLGVRRVTVVGASMGGMLAYAWLLECPDLVERAVIVGAPARHSPWAVGLNTAARSAIRAAPGGEGLKVARQIAMLSYRSPQSLALTQSGPSARRPGTPAITTYLEHQGEKLCARFCERTYLTLTEAMDRFQPTDAELRAIRTPTLVVGISSDVLYPPAEVQAHAALLRTSEYWELESVHGHDAFLMDPGELPRRVRAFLHSE